MQAVTESFCKALPKVELHAHLNGSISEITLRKLADHHEKKFGSLPEIKEAILKLSHTRTLDECFEIFGIIHKLSKDAEALRLVVHDVIKEFADDGVAYLELRTTPKELPETGLTKEQYVKVVVDAIDECKVLCPTIVVRLLLSIDRRNPLEEALDTVRLAVEFKSRGVVGVDFSGNPSVRHARDFEAAWTAARAGGLKLAIHFAEIVNHDESHYIIKTLKPGRIGHGTCVDEELEEEMICMTSNVLCKTVDSHDTHHFHDLYLKGYPCVICTDDKGVFCTTLSQEYLLGSRKLVLTREQLWELSYTSIDFIFADEEVAQRLREHWRTTKALVMATP